MGQDSALLPRDLYTYRLEGQTGSHRESAEEGPEGDCRC